MLVRCSQPRCTLGYADIIVYDSGERSERIGLPVCVCERTVKFSLVAEAV